MDQNAHGLATGSQNNIGESKSPFGYELWCRDDDANLSHREQDIELNSSGFARAESTISTLHEHPPNTTVTENDVCTHSSSSSSGVPTVSRRRKKPKGFPKRPLSGYNIFFKEERVKVLEEFNCHRVAAPADGVQVVGTKMDRSSVSFQDLGKIIGKRWKTLSDEDRRRFESLADQDNLRYRSEMDEYNDAKRKRNEEKSLRTIIDDVDDTITGTSPNSNSKSKWSTMVLTRPSDMHTSFHPYSTRTDDHPTTQNWQGPENAQHSSSSERTPQVFSYPIPPGTEITLPDHEGVERCYQVQYNFFKMTRRDAETYMAQLAQTPTVTPYGFTDFPPPPPGATYLHNPQWNG
jgi:HMG (high mobility group) box